MSAFLEAASALLGPNRLRLGPDMARHLTDPRGNRIGQARAVLLPEDRAEVQALMRLARDQGVPLIPQGGNTGLVAAALSPDPGAVVLSLERLSQIEIDPLGNTASTGAGVVLETLRGAAEAAGRMFPLSLGAQGSAQIGGLLSTNAGGVSVLKYGMMRELTLGIEVVLPDGSLLDERNRLRKNNVGYDLKQLFIGAEGSLGVITGAVLKLVPKPCRRQTAVLAIPSAAAALELFHAINEACFGLLSAFEFMAASALHLAEKNLRLSPPCLGRSGDLLLIELELPAALAESEVLESALSSPAVSGLWEDSVIASNEAQRKAFWTLRESLPEASWREGPVLSHDLSVPLSAIPEFLAELPRRLGPDWRVTAFGHIGDGNLHYGLIADDHSAEEIAAASASVYHMALELGGSFSAEHGLGRRKLGLAKDHLPAPAQRLRQQIKRLIDPDDRLNPGALFARADQDDR